MIDTLSSYHNLKNFSLHQENNRYKPYNLNVIVDSITEFTTLTENSLDSVGFNRRDKNKGNVNMSEKLSNMLGKGSQAHTASPAASPTRIRDKEAVNKFKPSKRKAQAGHTKVIEPTKEERSSIPNTLEIEEVIVK